MDNLPVYSIELGTHFHDDVDYHSTISSKTESNKIVLITTSNRKEGLSKLEETHALREDPKNPNWSKGKKNITIG